MAKAELEYDRFAAQRRALPSPVENHFEKAVREVKQIEMQRPPRGKLGTGKSKNKGKKR